MTLDELIACLDLTSLGEDDTTATIDDLIARSIAPIPRSGTGRGPDAPATAAICVWPRFVPYARAALARRGSAVRLATVVAFPSGQATAQERADEIASVLAAGADEIDMVLAADALEESGRACEELQAARVAAGSHLLKVIIETGRLETDARIQAATHLAIESGADFVKSSTGKGYPGVTPEAARSMCTAVASASAAASPAGPPVGVKFSGGIRDMALALSLAGIVEEVLGTQWLTPTRFRIGASQVPAT